ncbi:hypothetical protein [Saccharothrix obliqua]|uniref:hypothetical protein n=1 Tax=Saccharothrix obliqua TaxID=2861747 RepID=UPI001C603B6C|nr:hypothetical protein [Saccharothrix obliqua]MBW4719389.1 hypothetical protein [Saccharothrix obliqua]
MRTRLTRLALAVFVVGSGAAVGAGTAHAAEPVVVGDCATTVEGTPGAPVSLSPAAVTGPVTELVRAVPLLGPPLAEPFRAAFTALPPIPIGAVPTGTRVITGGEIADQVVGQLAGLPLLGPVLDPVTRGVRDTLTRLCGVTVVGVNAAVAPVQDASKAVADATGQLTGQPPRVPEPEPEPEPEPGPGTPPGGGRPGTAEPGRPGAPPPVGGVGAPDLPLYGSFGANAGRVPLFTYGSLPFAVPGGFTPSPGIRYGGNVPGYRPGYGLPGADADGVRTAGRAQALPGDGRGGGVAAPVLLAVLLLSCVTGALVRTWVLRRA